MMVKKVIYRISKNGYNINPNPTVALYCSERHTCKDTICRGFTYNTDLGPTITSCPYSSTNFKKIKMITFFEEKIKLAIEGGNILWHDEIEEESNV